MTTQGDLWHSIGDMETNTSLRVLGMGIVSMFMVEAINVDIVPNKYSKHPREEKTTTLEYTVVKEINDGIIGNTIFCSNFRVTYHARDM